MPVTVNVGEILQCNQNDDIRTRGCDPCVGLIVIYNAGGANRLKKCAHFSVGFAGPFNQGNIDAALNPILAGNFPLPNIVAVSFTWGGGGAGMGSVEIMNRLNAYFAGQPGLAASAINDSITTNGDNIQILNNQNWAFTNNPALNQNAVL